MRGINKDGKIVVSLLEHIGSEWAFVPGLPLPLGGGGCTVGPSQNNVAQVPILKNQHTHLTSHVCPVYMDCNILSFVLQ